MPRRGDQPKPTREERRRGRASAFYQERLRAARTPIGRFRVAADMLGARLTRASPDVVERITQELITTADRIGQTQ